VKVCKNSASLVQANRIQARPGSCAHDGQPGSWALASAYGRAFRQFLRILRQLPEELVVPIDYAVP